MSKSNVFRNGRVHVAARLCPTCIFRSGNLMDLRPGRVAQMVEECGEDGCIPCHETLGGDEDICRGFYDRHRNSILQVATRLGAVTFTTTNGGTQ